MALILATAVGIGCSEKPKVKPDERVTVHFPNGDMEVVPVFDVDGIPIDWVFDAVDNRGADQERC